MTDYTTHPDYRAMLAGIRSDPADDLKRLVLADWLDEHGQAERAELIRVQCRIAEMTRAPDEAARVQQHLKQKQAELIALHGHQWAIRGVINSPAGVVWINGEERETETRPVCEWSRGFLHTVRGPLASLIGGECERCKGMGGMAYGPDNPCPQCHGTGRTVGVLPALVREGVVERVEVTDREPWTDGVQEFEPSEYGWCWWREAEWGNRGGANNQLGNLPDSIIDVMADIYQYHRVTWNSPRDNQHIGFPTRNAAVSALSAALIRWAESEGEK